MLIVSSVCEYRIFGTPLDKTPSTLAIEVVTKITPFETPAGFLYQAVKAARVIDGANTITENAPAPPAVVFTIFSDCVPVFANVLLNAIDTFAPVNLLVMAAVSAAKYHMSLIDACSNPPS